MSTYSAKVSPAGMKVIKQFHLEDLLKKKEERAKREAEKLRKKNGPAKVNC